MIWRWAINCAKCSRRDLMMSWHHYDDDGNRVDLCGRCEAHRLDQTEARPESRIDYNNKAQLSGRTERGA